MRRQLSTALVVGGLVVVSLVAYKLAQPRTYTVRSTFAPQTGRSASANLSGLAAQFGITAPGADATQSPPFYADLITSDGILLELSGTQISLPGRGELAVTDALEIPSGPPATRADNGRRELAKMVSATAVAKTGVVRLSVVSEEAALSNALAVATLGLIDRYNLQRRRSQATSERRFVQAQAQEAAVALQSAENRLRDFLDQNRQWRGAATLEYRENQLQREVALRQQAYTQLVLASEQAKIDEVRDTPLISVVDPPRTPVRPDPRGLAIWGIVSMILGGSAGLVAALVRDAGFRRAQHASP
ncbi:MAG: hypothetical protein H0X64_00025 [Gemmatimonadaceae bacterium]|nr:hypothetical protein [Gemmatimonadaceae bacterium]